MKTFKELLFELEACSEAREWAGDKTIEEVVEQCHIGDWLLWLAARIDIGLQPLTLAKGHCANTVRHLMKDERSIKAVDVAIVFGEGKATRKELDDAYDTADAVADAAAYAAKKENKTSDKQQNGNDFIADVRRSFSYEEVQKIALDVMNLGMSLRQDQLNGWTDKSGNEVLKEYMDRL